MDLGSFAAPASKKVEFENQEGNKLAARIELPGGTPRAYAIFAHCFTCSKDIAAATRISRGLSGKGIAVLRFDFTGLGNSEGEFANTNFSSNTEDLISAANYLKKHFESPKLLIGHSLGGTAVLSAGMKIKGIAGVAAIAAPSDPVHVSHLFGDKIDEIRSKGETSVNLAGREFRIKNQFLKDLHEHDIIGQISDAEYQLLLLHSPVDELVDVEHSRQIFVAAKHPKSFISLHPADHLLTKPAHSTYVAEMIATWASRFLDSSGSW